MYMSFITIRHLNNQCYHYIRNRHYITTMVEKKENDASLKCLDKITLN